MKHLLPIALCAILLAGPALGADQTLLLREPDLSADHLAFVYAGDIWVAAPDGAQPRRLTSAEADEGNPIFSPDGSLIAFAADYGGNLDVYVVPTAGGQPRRLTWHPGPDFPVAWSADGRAVAFVSTRETDHGRSGQLYHVDLAGGLPAKRMEARFYRGAYDAAGGRLAYIAHGSGYNGLFGGSSGWKGYRGGTTPEMMVMDLARGGVVTIPGAGSTNFSPVWLGETLYFVSDREDEIHNIYRWNEADNSVARVSAEKVWDVRDAAGHGDVLVYEAGGRLWRQPAAGGAATEIVVSIAPDLPQLRPAWKDASRTIQGLDLSPTGKRALVTARGEVFTVPVEDGSTRNVTSTGDRREYSALWSPDGGELAWIVDSREGQTLVIANQDGRGERREYPLGPSFYDLRSWSGGDTPRIAYTDNHLSLYVIETDGGRITTIDTGVRRESVELAFSPAGDWLAYTHEQANYNRDLVLHDLAAGKRHVITDGAADVAAPAFSPDGKYLYFAASTNAGPIQVGLNMTSQERPYRAGLYAVVLAADGESPLLPDGGDEEAAGGDDKGDKEKKGGKGKKDRKDNGDDEEKADAATRIDLDGIAARIVALPVAERNYGNLAVGDDGALYYLDFPQPGGSNEPPGERGEAPELVRFDFDDLEAKTVMSGVRSFVVAADGKHVLLQKGRGQLSVGKLGAKIEAESLGTGDVRARIDPREEWGVIFDEVWRMEREYFYAPTLHGLDWDAVYARYRPLVAHVGRREDLNDLMVEMIGEMQAGHNRVGGGDVHREDGPGAGLLGANFELVDGRHRVTRVYTGESWNPFTAAPLAVPGNGVREGEFILAVNGHELGEGDNIFAHLEGTTGEQVTLRVGPRADGKDARDIVVEPTGSERGLRLWYWIEANRRRVAEATDGRVGYVYLPNTAGAGYTYFNRMFFAQVDKEALIIDERSNAGGQAANYIIEVLGRKHLSGWKDRDGEIYNTPMGAMHGPKLMLIDQDAGSGGDYLPWSFRYAGLGKLMGTRTWGGLIGISANPGLVDGGFLAVPFFRFFTPEGEWRVENEGVAPDIEVRLDPVQTNAGRDSQLEAAISEVLAELKGHRNTVPTEAPALPTELGK
ncbi:PD40 domain-containing protein [bacterium]|nr:PD40 domain-containing protein [bacterium]